MEKPTHKASTFASRTSRHANQSLAKSLPTTTHGQNDNTAKIKEK